MKRKGGLFQKINSFENLLEASRKARRGKRYKAGTARFEKDLEKNLFKIMMVLEEKSYEPGPYRNFYIKDPKKRLISAAPYPDRVIHHALINVIGPIIERSFIFDSYACIKEKGTHKAIERYRAFLPKNSHVLKCDIKKYFWNIDHDILLHQLEGKIKCQDTLWLIKKILDSHQKTEELEYFPGDDLFTPLRRKRGIPIGNLTSQVFSNLYLNGFDHFVKEALRVKYYIRYCDDFVVFGNSPQWLNAVRGGMEQYLETLRLKLHPNKSRVYRVTDGVDFLGFRIFPDHMRVRKSVVKGYRRKLREMVQDYQNGALSLSGVRASIQSWIGHVKHADSYRLREEMLSDVVFKRSLQGAGS
jgi:retron-type reverse transcriptase